MTLQSAPRTAVAYLALLAAPLLLARPPEPGGASAEGTSPEAPPGHRNVRGVERMVANAGRLAWSVQGDRIAFDRRGRDGLYDIHLIRPDGTGTECVSCDTYELRKANVLNPTWHPSGDSLVVQVQRPRGRSAPDLTDLATPHRGLWSELWHLRPDGRHPMQLTRLAERGRAVTDPHFSHEANRLLWSERLATGETRWGEWAVRVAEVAIKRGTPRLGKAALYEPGPGRGWIAAQGFTPDDGGFLFVAGERLFAFDLDARAARRLGGPAAEGIHAARFAPDGDHLVWASGQGLAPSGAQRRLPRRSDLWIAAVDGEPGRSVAERLTFFNDPDSDHFLGAALVDDLAWNRRGDALALHVVYTRPEGVAEAIYVVRLATPYR